MDKLQERLTELTQKGITDISQLPLTEQLELSLLYAYAHPKKNLEFIQLTESINSLLTKSTFDDKESALASRFAEHLLADLRIKINQALGRAK
jgi:hypothetical protein